MFLIDVGSPFSALRKNILSLLQLSFPGRSVGAYGKPLLTSYTPNATLLSRRSGHRWEASLYISMVIQVISEVCILYTDEIMLNGDILNS
mmetsp:Transcript_34600/g.56122  ORF Transcript_34600/g.56122 Transcript_34600/m.56122 type:complete len:90 (-) Transcript_34600:174-443(-)